MQQVAEVSAAKASRQAEIEAEWLAFVELHKPAIEARIIRCAGYYHPLPIALDIRENKPPETLCVGLLTAYRPRYNSLSGPIFAKRLESDKQIGVTTFPYSATREEWDTEVRKAVTAWLDKERVKQEDK